MIGFAWTLAYISGFVICYRHLYVRIMEHDLSLSARHNSVISETEKAEMRVTTATISMLGALIWPFTAFGLGLLRFATPQTPTERNAELDERERRIAKLERDLGITP